MNAFKNIVLFVAPSLLLASASVGGVRPPAPDIPVVAVGYCIDELAAISVRDIAWGPGGAWSTDLYASTGNSIVKIAPDGTVTPFVRGLLSPTGIAFSTSGAFGNFLYVAQDAEGVDNIVRITSGGVVSPFGTAPASLGIDLIDLLFAPGTNGYSDDLYVTDLGGCGCTPGRVLTFTSAGGAGATPFVNNGTSPTGIAVVSGGAFGSATIMFGDVANGASDDGAFWTISPANIASVFLSSAGPQIFNPHTIAQTSGATFSSDLYLSDLGVFIPLDRTFVVYRRDGGGALSTFVSGLEVDAYHQGRVAFSPSGTLLAVNSANAVYLVHQSQSGDLNGDGVVDGADAGLLLADWGTSNSLSDLNCDGTVDGADFGLLLSDWG